MSNVAEVRDQGLKITLNDGIERTIKFTLNALAELEDRYGSVEAAFDKLEKEHSMKALRCILWAGFIHESPNMTEFEVGNLIDIASMQDLTATLGEALEKDLPQKEEAIAKPAGGTSEAKVVDNPNG